MKGQGNETSRVIRSFVLRSGRMTDSQKKSYDSLYGKYSIPELEAETPPADGSWIASAFGRDAPLVVEIGFGMGMATTAIAETRAEMNFLGIEVHRPGVGKILSDIEARGISNLRVHEGDAIAILSTRVPEGSLAGIHLFFPDPWQKARHHKRRIVRPEYIELFASRLAKGGYFYMVTDWDNYAEESLQTISGCALLENPSSGFAPRQPWRPLTKFEARAEREGRQVQELYFIKK